MQAGTPVLRRRAREVTPDQIRSSDVQQLIEAMRETMRDAPGVGLAAPQIGIGMRLAVIEDRAEYQTALTADALSERARKPVPFHVIINPVLELVGDPVEFFEGCLSVHGMVALVARASAVRVSCLNHAGEPVNIDATGWHARILQHETDHLNGMLYVDRMHPRSLMTVDAHSRFWKDMLLTDVKNRLEL